MHNMSMQSQEENRVARSQEEYGNDKARQQARYHAARRSNLDIVAKHRLNAQRQHERIRADPDLDAKIKAYMKEYEEKRFGSKELRSVRRIERAIKGYVFCLYICKSVL
jgi:hypothetical protein